MKFFSLFSSLKDAFSDASNVSIELFKILIPITITLKILTELDWIQYTALPLEPVMSFLGLPAALGLAWATGIMLNIYSSLFVFISLMPSLPPLSVEQVTVFGLLNLIAHSLILEGRIASACNVSFWPQVLTRFVTAVAAGFFLHTICTAFGFWQDAAVIAFHPEVRETSLLFWIWDQIQNYLAVFFVIFMLMIVQRILKYFHVTDFLSKLLKPVLLIIGTSPAAASIMIYGIVMGLLYGSGIIINEARKGSLSAHDTFAVMTFMGIAHSLIEDTLVISLLGGSLIGLLLFRLAVAFVLSFCINMYSKYRNTAAA
ncbi:MAG: nucleoside recognition protein [Desulfovibrionaceae bacterium]|nr:nucleoside recognition protein [Desulfovibrionaceae bacterium]